MLGLRVKADTRTLLYAFVLFPAVPAVQYANPALVGWLLPLGLYCGFCAGVLTHNQNHSPTFVNKRLSAYFAAWLSIFYGYPTFGWIPTHNQNHHKFVNRPGDASITWRYSKKHNWTVAWTYFFVSSFFQSKSMVEYINKARASNPPLFHNIVMQYVFVIGGHSGMAALAIALHGWGLGALVYGVGFLLPALFSLWAMFFINYIQHVHCDPWSKYDHSRNFVGRLSNWLTFNAGLHAAHHEQAGLHWSKLWELHNRLAPHIHPDLKQHSLLGFCFKTYVLGMFSDRFRTHQIGRPAWSPPGDGPVDLTIGSVESTEAGINASMA
jgi:fatty acid desaturase